MDYPPSVRTTGEQHFRAPAGKSRGKTKEEGDGEWLGKTRTRSHRRGGRHLQVSPSTRIAGVVVPAAFTGIVTASIENMGQSFTTVRRENQHPDGVCHRAASKQTSEQRPPPDTPGVEKWMQTIEVGYKRAPHTIQNPVTRGTDQRAYFSKLQNGEVL